MLIRLADNNKRYGVPATSQANAHRRSASVSHHLEGLQGPELSGILRPVQTPNTVDADVFPPLRAQAPDNSIFLPYVTEDIAFEEEYQEYLHDLGWSDDHSSTSSHSSGATSSSQGSTAWHRLPELVSDITDSISDSESIASIGELEETPLDSGKGDSLTVDENRNNWEVRRLSKARLCPVHRSPRST